MVLNKTDFVNAAKLIEKKGWVQNEYGDQTDKGYCAAGALGKVLGGRPASLWNHNFPNAVKESLTKDSFGVEGEIINFNDDVLTKKDDVLTFLLLLGEIAAS
jgi:signal peptidase I